jgi:mono/diheme cytochrome c family protein
VVQGTYIRLHLRNSAALVTFMVGAVFALSPASAQETAQKTPSPARGEYVFNLAGCEGCHTDKKNNGPRLAGGREFKTDFGVFYSPNITPDPTTGIGAWSESDFTAALRHGKAPNGSNYFPAFPYPSYTHMSDGDVADLWAYLKAQPAISQTNQPHKLDAPFGWRWLVMFWNWLYLDTGPQPEWSRGRYIAQALSHCHECHTPRNALGGYDADMPYAGTPRNPEGIVVPNITPDKETGIGKWSRGDLEMLFTIGMLPDGDFVGGVMAESVSHATSKMTPQDRVALIEYLSTLNSIANPVKVKKARKSGESDWQ